MLYACWLPPAAACCTCMHVCTCRIGIHVMCMYGHVPLLAVTVVALQRAKITPQCSKGCSDWQRECSGAAITYLSNGHAREIRSPRLSCSRPCISQCTVRACPCCRVASTAADCRAVTSPTGATPPEAARRRRQRACAGCRWWRLQWPRGCRQVRTAAARRSGSMAVALAAAPAALATARLLELSRLRRCRRGCRAAAAPTSRAGTCGAPGTRSSRGSRRGHNPLRPA